MEWQRRRELRIQKVIEKSRHTSTKRPLRNIPNEFTQFLSALNWNKIKKRISEKKETGTIFHIFTCSWKVIKILFFSVVLHNNFAAVDASAAVDDDGIFFSEHKVGRWREARDCEKNGWRRREMRKTTLESCESYNVYHDFDDSMRWPDISHLQWSQQQYIYLS